MRLPFQPVVLLAGLCWGLCWGLVLGPATGCRQKAQTTVQTASPHDIDGDECAVCGMMVAEQPAPHGQLVRRDGSRAFTCSLGDLRADLSAPSPHGKPVAVWVQTLPPGYDPSGVSPSAGPWVTAADAFYVAGVDRPTVMGRPVLAYSTQAQADAAAVATGGHVVTWQALEQTPFSQDPPAQDPPAQDLLDQGKKTPSK